MVLPAIVAYLAPIAVATAAAVVAPEVGKLTRQNVFEDQEIRDVASNREFNALRTKGFRDLESQTERERKLIDLPLLGDPINYFPGINAIDPNRERRYYNSVLASLKDKGYNNRDAERIAQGLTRIDIRGGAGGEVVGTATLSTLSEGVGKFASKKVIPKVVDYAATRGFGLSNPLVVGGAISSGIGGLFEGTTTILQQDISRRQLGQRPESFSSQALGFAKGSKKARVVAQAEALGFGALGGALSAGFFGGIITGQSVARPKLSKATERFAYAIDPFEPVGDITERGLTRLRGGKEPTIRIRNAPVVSISPTTQSQSLLNTLFPSQTQTATSTKTSTKSNTRTQQLTFQGRPVNIISGVPTPVQVPNNISTREFIGEVPGDTDRGKQNTQTPSDTETPSDTTTNANTSTAINVPSSSVLFRGNIPIPPLLGGPVEYDRFGANSSKKFQNELRKSSRLFRSLL